MSGPPGDPPPPLARTVERHATLGSTNDRARELISAGARLPALVVADRQTAGRGRGGNRWWAAEGALAFSLLIDPAEFGIEPARQGLLAISTGLAVIDAVHEATGLAAGLKWPNDVLLRGKKLAGVLIEAPRTDRWIIGVGVNVENRLESAPLEVRDRAATLADTPGATRPVILDAFLRSLPARLAQVRTSDPQLMSAARAACVLTGQRVTVVDGARELTGDCRGLADDGALLLAAGGEVRRVESGSVIAPVD